MFNAVMEAPFGKIGVRVTGEFVSEIVYLPETVATVEAESPLAQRAVEQIAAYLHTPSVAFDLPLAHTGTAFQRRVWQVIGDIPAGAVRTYGELAKTLDSVPRAVGQACGSNRFPIVIPCHRVVGSGGIGGFAHTGGDGYYRNVKRWLLQHEGVPNA